MTHGRFIFRMMVITVVACVVRAANECLHVMMACATTVLAEQASAVPEAPPLVNNGGSSSEHGSIDSGAGGGREAFPLREAVRTT